MKVLIKHVGDTPVERIGETFHPGKEYELEINPNFLHLLAACKHLEVEEIKEKKKRTAKKKSDS